MLGGNPVDCEAIARQDGLRSRDYAETAYRGVVGMALSERTHSILRWSVFPIVGFLIVLPHLFFGYPDGHSAGFNVPWLEFFSRQLFDGNFYPRWLTDYANGLGAPVFYFYAPGPFYLSALSGAVLCPGCHAAQVLSIGHWAIFTLSGAAFYVWIVPLSDRPVGLITSTIYMLLPYHFLDLEIRATLGESMAYIWMPLILYGLRRASSMDRWALLAAFAYAGLVMSHLPSALLFAPIMIVFALARATRKTLAHEVSKVAAIGLLGVALAAVYLVPALMMLDTLAADAWVTGAGAHYFAENWLLYSGRDMPAFGYVVYVALATSTALALVGGLIIGFHPQDGSLPSSSRPVLIAAGVSLALCWLMMSVVAEPLWVHVSVLRQVQFPWRLGTIVDTCAITILSIALWRMKARPAPGVKGGYSPRKSVLPPGVVLIVIASLMVLTMWGGRANYTRQAWVTPDPAFYRYGLEYRTKWVVDNSWDERGYALEDAPVLDSPKARILDREERGDTIFLDHDGPTSFKVTASLREAATVELRLHYFPHWRLIDTKTGALLSIRPSPRTGLVRFALQAGEHNLRLAARYTKPEVLGMTISVLALLIAALVAGYHRRYAVRSSLG